MPHCHPALLPATSWKVSVAGRQKPHSPVNQVGVCKAETGHGASELLSHLWVHAREPERGSQSWEGSRCNKGRVKGCVKLSNTHRKQPWGTCCSKASHTNQLQKGLDLPKRGKKIGWWLSRSQHSSVHWGTALRWGLCTRSSSAVSGTAVWLGHSSGELKGLRLGPVLAMVQWLPLKRGDRGGWLCCAATLQGAKRTFLHVLSSAVSNSNPEQLCSSFLCYCETPGTGSRFICRTSTVKFLHPPSPEMSPLSVGFGACGTREGVSCSSVVPYYHSAGVSCRNRRCPTATGDRHSDLCSQRNSGSEKSPDPCAWRDSLLNGTRSWEMWSKLDLFWAGLQTTRLPLPTTIILRFCGFFSSCVSANITCTKTTQSDVLRSPGSSPLRHGTASWEPGRPESSESLVSLIPLQNFRASQGATSPASCDQPREALLLPTHLLRAGGSSGGGPCLPDLIVACHKVTCL